MEENQSVLVSFAKIVFCAGLIDLKGISGSSPAVERVVSTLLSVKVNYAK